MTKRKTKANEEDDASTDGDITSTLLKLVVKVTEVLTTNSELQNEIQRLRQCNDDLLKRVETLEERSGDWSPQSSHHHRAPMSDVMALTSTVTDELQARKDKEQNLVIYGLQETASSETDSEEVEKAAVCALLNTIQVPRPNVWIL